MFTKDQLYRHSNPNASLDIYVIDVISEEDKAYSLRVNYITRNLGNLQYTGKGEDGFTDFIEIQKENIKDWKPVI